MKEDLRNKIIRILVDSDDYITATSISEILNISSKTVLNYINDKQFSKFIEQCSIEKIQNLGIKLVGSNLQIKELKRKISDYSLKGFDSNNFTDISYILDLLLTDKNPVYISELSDSINVNFNYTNKILESVKLWLSVYNIKLEKYENKGIKLSGNEIQIRDLYKNIILERISDIGISKIIENDFYKTIEYSFPLIKIEELRLALNNFEKVLNKKLTAEDYKLNIIKLAIQITRIYIGCEIDKDMSEKICDLKEYYAAQIIKMNIENSHNIIVSNIELKYLAKNLLGSRNQNSNDILVETKDNDIDKFVLTIGESLGINLSEDKILLDNLRLHLEPAIRRLHCGVSVENLLLSRIKNEFTDIYISVLTTIEIIENINEIAFDSNEIGYICLHIVASINRMGNCKKINACLCCDNGITMSNYIISVINNKIPEIKITKVISSDQIEDEIDSCDLILNTSNNNENINEKIIDIDELIKIDDVAKINNWILKNHIIKNDEYLKTEIFENRVMLYHDEVNDRFELLKKYGDLLLEKGHVKEDFSKSLMERESRSSTTIGRGIAVPHGLKEYVLYSCILIIKLKKPIMWDNQLTDLVFLLAINHDTDTKNNNFFRKLYRIIADEKSLNKLKSTDDIGEIKELFEKREY